MYNVNNHPKVTVLVPTFNRGEYLKECLDSLINQTLPAYQIVVINDGSTDHTKSVCASYGEAVEYHELKQIGKPGAVNYGLEHARGDYIWIFDDDDVAFPEALERFVRPLEGNPDYGFSYSTFNFTRTDQSSGRIGSVIFEMKMPDLATRGFLVPLLEWNFLGGAALFARTSCYQAVGYFDPKLLRSQDYEMAIRIARRFKGAFVDGGPTFHYRQHAGDRGARRDRFSITKRQQKWTEYDRKFFAGLYHEIPLTEYLQPGIPAGKGMRQAIFQRMSIMSNKLLIEEVLEDLRALAVCDDQAPLALAEYAIVREMVVRGSYYGERALYDHWAFFSEIRRLARASRVMRLLRPKVLRALLARLRNHPRLDKVFGGFYRIVRLYVL